MAAFKPGLSPPAVKMPMRLVLVIVSATFESVKGAVCREITLSFRINLSPWFHLAPLGAVSL
jgi:hypothetical protein